jgi:hypothetical protein
MFGQGTRHEEGSRVESVQGEWESEVVMVVGTQRQHETDRSESEYQQRLIIDGPSLFDVPMIVTSQQARAHRPEMRERTRSCARRDDAYCQGISKHIAASSGLQSVYIKLREVAWVEEEKGITADGRIKKRS